MRLNHVLLSGVFLIFPATTFASAEENHPEQGISTYIIGGEATTLNQIPFFARVILYKSGSNQFLNICGGSIINDRFILTAAHCVDSDALTDGWNARDLRVLIKNPTMTNVEASEFKSVSRIIIHPDYNPDDLWVNDLALLELSQPITENVQSITLPQDFGDYSDAPAYQIFGLGQTSNKVGSTPDYLRWAEVKPLTDSECADLITGFHSQESLCANGFEDREYSGVCLGDSGGPLTYIDGNGMYQQIGIVSYGSSDCEQTSFPSVFTEVLNYTTWIEQQTSSGVKTSYDAELAATEDYYKPNDISRGSNSNIGSGSDSENGGSIGSGLLLISVSLGLIRRRKQKASVRR